MDPYSGVRTAQGHVCHMHQLWTFSRKLVSGIRIIDISARNENIEVDSKVHYLFLTVAPLRRIWTACLVETMPFVRQMVLNVRSNYVYVLITKLISWFYNSVVSSAVKDLIFWTIVVGPAAFRPRAHATANYTPSVEKGRPILQGLLSIDFLAKEVFEIFSV